jgi:polar amino acid transport system substrate-binding protein
MTASSESAARAALAPTGTLRVGLNYSNFLITKRPASGGEPGGIAADLAREIARRLGVPTAFVGYESPGVMADGAAAGAWDIAFLGAEPARANVIEFTAAYLEIEATYLVPAGSPIRSIEEVDRPGVRISLSGRSAYDLYLSRTIQHAQLVRVDGIEASYQQFVKDKLDVLAGLKPRLVADAAKQPGSRILEGRFTAIQQSIGTPRGRDEAGGRYLRAFVEEAKSSGLVARVIQANGIQGVSVAPLAS